MKLKKKINKKPREKPGLTQLTRYSEYKIEINSQK